VPSPKKFLSITASKAQRATIDTGSLYTIVPIDAPRTALYVGPTANVRPGNLPAEVIWRIRFFKYALGSFQSPVAREHSKTPRSVF
jgi:hypothetical protein